MGDRLPNIARLSLQRVSRFADPQWGGGFRLPIALLHDMRQFVDQQFTPCRCLRPVMIRAEYYMRTDSIRTGVHSPSGTCRLSIGVYSHLTEVLAQTRFGETAGGLVEGLTGSLEDIMHDARSVSSSGDGTFGSWAWSRALLAAGCALSSGRHVLTAGTGAL